MRCCTIPSLSRALAFSLPLAVAFAAVSARAQVSVNLHALQGLAPAPASHPVQQARPRLPAAPLPLPPMPPGTPVPPTSPAVPPPPTMAGTSIGPLPRLPPKTPPALPAIAPVKLVGPPHPEPIPPPPAVAANAPGAARAMPDGLRVTFGDGDAVLNPATYAALKRIAQAAAKDHAQWVSVDAYAPRDTSDPSTPRRLSLSRALAARAVLREAGIPSERIYVRALLADPLGPAPANRVDVTLAHTRSAAKGSP